MIGTLDMLSWEMLLESIDGGAVFCRWGTIMECPVVVPRDAISCRLDGVAKDAPDLARLLVEGANDFWLKRRDGSIGDLNMLWRSPPRVSASLNV